jgi:DNA-binding NtrC family response regulator
MESAEEFELGGTESILVVDDIEMQREVTGEMLTSLGYDVFKAVDGIDALHFLKNNRVDLVILDMILGKGIDGLDTYTEIIKQYPDQKVIVASGFSPTERVLKMQQLGAGTYIKKPFTLKTIGEAVRSELDREIPTEVK